MKISNLFFTSILLTFSLIFVACSSEGANSETTGEGNTEIGEADFPTENITIIVHTSSGGPTDLMARELARAAEEILDTTIVVENNPGGSGATAMSQVHSADPDGYTLGAMTPTQIGLINGTLEDQYGIEDFSWLSRGQIDPYILVVNDDSPFNTLEDVVGYLEESPGGLNVAGYGAAGSGHNVAWNIFAESAGVEANWTPYESTGDAVTAILGNHVDIANSNPGQVMQYVESGELRILGVMADDRLEKLPDVPTYEDAGYSVDTNWAHFRGFFAPEGVPEETLEKLSEAFLEAYESESYQDYMESSQLVEGGMGYEEYSDFINSQNNLTEKWYERLGVK